MFAMAGQLLAGCFFQPVGNGFNQLLFPVIEEMIGLCHHHLGIAFVAGLAGCLCPVRDGFDDPFEVIGAPFV